MAVLYVSEFSQLVMTPNGLAAMGQQPSLRDQTIAIGSGSLTPMYAFLPATKFVRLHTDSICSIAFGPFSSVVATSANARMAANQTEYFGVPQSSNGSVAVITNV